ncbi:MAG: hypothetical protein NZU63_04680 [Gemmataceae bacterium]|nr:hypothetical protein [Gemmataceae bacterium]MDW8241921.1 hypothetical protein [Thermogemmata sp.]
MWFLFSHPLVLAGLVTVANGLKPVVVDDTAYLLYAQHIAVCPRDPYGFTIFWYTWPQPAFEVLAPPVYLYWLAGGWWLFGDHVALLKVWTWPWLVLLAYSLRGLLRQVASAAAGWMLPLLLFSPAVLPAVNLMLDIPAYALGSAALCLWGGLVQRSLPLAQTIVRTVLVGLLLGLAAQTKYSLLTFFPVLLLWGVLQRRWGITVAAVVTASAVFWAWEAYCLWQYGASHFWYHVQAQRQHGSFLDQLWAKLELVGPLCGYWGCLGAAIAWLTVWRLGIPSPVVRCLVGMWLGGMALVGLLPERYLVLPDGSSLVALFWQGAGVVALITAATAVLLQAVLLQSTPGGNAPTSVGKHAVFLLLWWLIELAGYFLLTPFGAARRLIGLTLVSHLAVGRLYDRIVPESMAAGSGVPRHAPPGWLVAASMSVGITVATIDVLDAYPEKWCVEQAARVLRSWLNDQPETVWFAGHWGFQHYAQRQGWQPLVPQESRVCPGQFVVLPVHPDADHFYRPHVGSRPIVLPAGGYETLAEIVWDDPLAAQTIPNYYGGMLPLIGRNHPRLRVLVAQMRTDWQP